MSTLQGSSRVLENDHLILEVDPSSGGSVTRFDYKDINTTHPIFRRCKQDLSASQLPLEASCFPLVPYSNRLRHGVFSVNGKVYRHELNCPPEIHSSHGDGWMRPWEISDSSDRHIEMRLEAFPHQPIKYSAVQSLKLRSDRLSISLEVTNADTVLSPFGLGLHPYFHRAAGAQIRCDLKSHWQLDDELLPTNLVDNPRFLAMKNGLNISDLPTVGAYYSQSTNADIFWPSTGLKLRLTTIPVQRHAILWCPEGNDFFCYEPVSHMIDAFNMINHGTENCGVIYLNPGDSHKVIWDFSIVKLSH